MSKVCQVKIHDLTGKSVTLTLPTECTVDQMYQEIVNQGFAGQGSTVENIRIIYEGIEVEKGKKKFLHDYGIPSGATLYMVVRAVGGIACMRALCYSAGIGLCW